MTDTTPHHDDIRKMRRQLEEEIRTVIGMLLNQDRGADAGQVILALRRELTKYLILAK